MNLHLRFWHFITCNRFKKYSRKAENSGEYHNLASTSNADKDGVYANALNCAVNDPEVFNIALTSPYGSGKSSIIKAFLKNYPKIQVLQISLASFLPEAESINTDAEAPLQNGEQPSPQKQTLEDRRKTKKIKQEIERSILQQMLYGQGANKLSFHALSVSLRQNAFSGKFYFLYLAFLQLLIFITCVA